MSSFELCKVPSIRCQAGLFAELGRHLSSLGIRGTLLVVMDQALNGRAQALQRQLLASSYEALVEFLPAGEPKESFVRDVRRQYRHSHFDAVIAIGGGSVLDAGKLLACVLGSDEDIAKYRLAAHPMPTRQPTLLCMPTTAGTGSEATAVSVLADSDGTKNWFWSESLRADYVLLDPELTVGLPAAVTAASGADALVHAIEAATNRYAHQTNNVFCYHAIRLVTRALPTALGEPSNLAARAGMLEAATFAGIGISNTGTGIAHNIGHALGSLAGIPHGRAVAIGLNTTLVWSIHGHEAAYAGVAAAMGVGSVQALPGAFSELLARSGVDVRLAPHPKLTAQALADQMAQEENRAMREASRRTASDGALLHFATAVLNAQPADPRFE